MDERRLGVASGLAAYSMWGLFPLYFPLLEPAGGLEIVAHRVVWSVVFVALLLTAVRRRGHVRAVLTDRRALLVLSGAALLIAALGFQAVGYAPCELCILQRWPHVAAIAVALGIWPRLSEYR